MPCFKSLVLLFASMVVGFLSAFLVTLALLVAVILYCCVKKCKKLYRKEKQNGDQDPTVSSSTKDIASCASGSTLFSIDTDSSEREIYNVKQAERNRVQELSMQSQGVIVGRLFKNKKKRGKKNVKDTKV